MRFSRPWVFSPTLALLLLLGGCSPTGSGDEGDGGGSRDGRVIASSSRLEKLSPPPELRRGPGDTAAGAIEIINGQHRSTPDNLSGDLSFAILSLGELGPGMFGMTWLAPPETFPFGPQTGCLSTVLFDLANPATITNQIFVPASASDMPPLRQIIRAELSFNYVDATFTIGESQQTYVIRTVYGESMTGPDVSGTMYMGDKLILLPGETQFQWANTTSTNPERSAVAEGLIREPTITEYVFPTEHRNYIPVTANFLQNLLVDYELITDPEKVWTLRFDLGNAIVWREDPSTLSTPQELLDAFRLKFGPNQSTTYGEEDDGIRATLTVDAGNTGISLVATEPAHGTTGVSRNASVGLHFSRPIDLVSLESAMVIDDGVLPHTPVSFTLAAASGNWVVVSFPAALPPNAMVTVSIDTTAQSQIGTFLDPAASFSFTTGDDIDTTAPTLLSMTPPNGTTISSNTDALVLTFSERIADDSLEPTMLSAQFAALLESSGVEPSWSEDGTVLTVALPAPLPAGLPIVADFAGYADVAGNPAATGFEIDLVVEGTADFFPFVNGSVSVYLEEEVQDSGLPTSYESHVRGEERMDGNFAFVSFGGDPNLGEVASTGMRIFSRSATEVLFRGFLDIPDEGAPTSMEFDPSAVYLKFPMTPQSWSATTAANGGGTVTTIEYSVEILGVEDIPARLGEGVAQAGPGDPQGSPSLWVDCWKTVFSYEMWVDEQLASSGVDSLWFAPAVGIVREVSSETDFTLEQTFDRVRDLVDLDLFD